MTYNDLWIPVNRRRMTEDEEKAIREQYEIEPDDEENLFAFENVMPKNGERVLVTYEYTLGGVTKRAVYVDYCGYDKVCYTLKNCGTWEKITAWMPYPQAYTTETHRTPVNAPESVKGIKISPEEHNALYKASDALMSISERMTEQGIKEIKFAHKDEIPNKYSAGMLNGIARALYEIDKAKEG